MKIWLCVCVCVMEMGTFDHKHDKVILGLSGTIIPIDSCKGNLKQTDHRVKWTIMWG